MERKILDLPTLQIVGYYWLEHVIWTVVAEIKKNYEKIKIKKKHCENKLNVYI